MNKYNELFDKAKNEYSNGVQTPPEPLGRTPVPAPRPSSRGADRLPQTRPRSMLGSIVRHAITLVILCLITLGVLYGPMVYRELGYWWRTNHRDEVPESLVNALYPGELANFQIDSEARVAPVIPPDDRLVIDKIEVNAPIVMMDGVDNDTVLNTIKHGAGMYPNMATPGKAGLTFLTGHSSYWWWDDGGWKFIFQHLEDLVIGDKITIYYHQKRYDYEVTELEVIKPSGEEADRVFDQEDFIGLPAVRIMTCVPVGTSLNRLIVTARQVSPDPALTVVQDNDTVDVVE